jgi:hypothetical protein
MGLDMLLQVLRAFEGFLAEVALVRLKRNMNTDVRGNMVALNSRGVALVPSTGEVEVVGALASNMAFTHMVLRSGLELLGMPKEERAWKFW